MSGNNYGTLSQNVTVLKPLHGSKNISQSPYISQVYLPKLITWFPQSQIQTTTIIFHTYFLSSDGSDEIPYNETTASDGVACGSWADLTKKCLLARTEVAPATFGYNNISTLCNEGKVTWSRQLMMEQIVYTVRLGNVFVTSTQHC